MSDVERGEWPVRRPIDRNDNCRLTLAGIGSNPWGHGVLTSLGITFVLFPAH